MLDLIRQRAQSWGVKIAFGIIIIVFVFWGVGASTNTGPGVAATVNGKPILLQDFQKELSAKQNEIRALAPDFSAEDMRSLDIPRQILQMMVSRMVVEQEADRVGLAVSPLELLRYLETEPYFHGPDGKFSQEVYEKVLAAQGINVGDFEQGLMRNLLAEKMRMYVGGAVTVSPEEAKRRFGFQMERRAISYALFPTADYRKGVTVSDEAVKEYYEANQSRFLEPAAAVISYIEATPDALAPSMDVPDEKVEEAYAFGPLRYNLRQILLPLPEKADEAAENAVREKLAAMAEEIRAGKSFDEAAKAVADDPAAIAGEDLGWIPSRQLPPEVLGALAGVKKGGVTAPVKTGAAYSLLLIADSDPDWTQPEAVVKASLRDSIAKDMAALAFRDVQNQAEDLVALGKPLEEIAQELKLGIKTTKPAPREEIAFVLGLRKPGQADLFGGEKGLISAILETREGFLVAAVDEQREARVTPLEDVREVVVDVLTRREAEKRAEEAARKAVAEFADGAPAAYKDSLVVSEPFDRTGDIPGLGLSKSLADAVFAAPLDKWLAEPHATPKGAVIAMPVESIQPTAEEWQRIEPNITRSLLDAKRTQVFTAFVAELVDNAKVIIASPAILEQ